MNMTQNNLYKYSQNLNLSSLVEIKNDENNINSKDLALLNQKTSFLKDLANILENKLKNNIRLHQKGFEIYKQKILSDKNLILNTINKDLRNLTINQLLALLKQIKEDENKEKLNNYFNLGKNMNNNNINYNDEVDMNNENQNSIEMINKMFNDYSNLKNIDIINSNKFTNDFNNFANNENSVNNTMKYKSQNNNTNNKLGFKNIGYNDPRLIYHSPSPLILKKQDSKIIEDNKNANNQIDFDEPQNC
jgi:hypothetical protein